MIKITDIICATFLMTIIFSFSAFAGTIAYTYDEQGRVGRMVYRQAKPDDSTVVKTITVECRYDWAGNMIEYEVDTDRLAGDIDDDQVVGLRDAVRTSQIQSGIPAPGKEAAAADVNGDWRIGEEESVFILQKAAELR